jgi:hypothetical protein
MRSSSGFATDTMSKSVWLRRKVGGKMFGVWKPVGAQDLWR